MKVYIVNVNNCEAYSDYYEGNRGVYQTYQQAVDAMTAQGFDPSTKIKIIPWYADEDGWLEEGWYDREEYRIEEWEIDERTCKFVSSKGSDYPPVCSACGYDPGIYECAWYEGGTYRYERNYCPNCGARVANITTFAHVANERK